MAKRAARRAKLHAIDNDRIHSLVFDHTGKPVFRGSPLDAEPYIRVAVGKAVLARVGKESVGTAARWPQRPQQGGGFRSRGRPAG